MFGGWNWGGYGNSYANINVNKAVNIDRNFDRNRDRPRRRPLGASRRAPQGVGLPRQQHAPALQSGASARRGAA
jgi:hypothetical protein